jgi:C4-dicarboxylate-specific signal transduction histidine kinase
MRTAIEQAGAERGLLILLRGAEPRIEAEATTDGDTVLVQLRDQPVTAAVLPESVLHYVMRTRKNVILDDAAAQPPFADDPYIRERQARSILCLPLITQAKLIGVLYLENNLAPRVFALARSSVLKLLASQAAISLENSRLYSDLAEREAEARESERRYREVQTELAHANRVATMGQLAASIAHEVKQPITGVVTNAHAALRWLGGQPPDLKEVRHSVDEIIKDGNRAGDVVDRIRALIKKAPSRIDRLDINAGIREVIELTRGEAVTNGVSVQTDLADSLPLIDGDRVQLQQVILNLMMNAIEAMSGVSDGTRELRISTRKAEPGGVLVAVRDSGPGLAPATLEHLFNAFYTTKPGGLGLGLSICRSIIEAHGGRLWASANVPRGAIFEFAVPAHQDITS